jgi:hypothetical protein
MGCFDIGKRLSISKQPWGESPRCWFGLSPDELSAASSLTLLQGPEQGLEIVPVRLQQLASRLAHFVYNWVFSHHSTSVNSSGVQITTGS